ncbi:hypothetical protein SUDANB178_07574 [Streptomyces sp. enrichment culture]
MASVGVPAAPFGARPCCRQEAAVPPGGMCFRDRLQPTVFRALGYDEKGNEGQGQQRKAPWRRAVFQQHGRCGGRAGDIQDRVVVRHETRAESFAVREPRDPQPRAPLRPARQVADHRRKADAVEHGEHRIIAGGAGGRRTPGCPRTGGPRGRRGERSKHGRQRHSHPCGQFAEDVSGRGSRGDPGQRPLLAYRPIHYHCSPPGLPFPEGGRAQHSPSRRRTPTFAREHDRPEDERRATRHPATAATSTQDQASPATPPRASSSVRTAEHVGRFSYRKTNVRASAQPRPASFYAMDRGTRYVPAAP